MIGTGMNGVKTIGRGRLEGSEEYRLAHNLLRICRDPEAFLGRAFLLDSGD
jgi:hypothetical protein